MKTAEQIAQEVAAQVKEHGAVKFMGGNTYTTREFWAEIAERAILADRAQHDLTYARQVIDRNDGRAVIWGSEDILSYLEDWHGNLPKSEREEIADRAMDSYYWRALDDDTENGWEHISMAIKEAMK